MASHLSDVWFSVTPLEVASGRGCTVTTVDGAEYLDFSAGIAVVSTGHCHPKVVAAIQSQAARFVHAQVNVYRHDLLEPLAARLAELAPGPIDTFFYANSGAEITEAAVKLAKQATKRPNVIVFSGSFHGRTHLAMAMTTSKTSYRAGYAPLPSGVFVAPFPDPLAPDQDAEVGRGLDGLHHLLKAMTAPEETAAMILEPLLGEGGYVPAPAPFVRGVADLCREHGIVFVADEVQTGFGRTGRMFAVEHYGVQPDVICLAKGIASGFPFAALGASAELMARWPTGSHGGTYGGNPIGCAAALATIEVLTEPGFLDNVRARGEQLMSGLSELQAEDEGILQVRGLGLMVGTELADATRVAAVQRHMLEEGKVIVMNAGTYGRTLRWMPPLVVSEREISHALAAFGAALKATSYVAGGRPDPERLAVWRAFLEANAALTRVLEQELEEQRGLSLHWYDVLVQLQEAGGRLRMQELADRVLLHKSSISRLVDRMEAAGLVARAACPSDGRSRYAVLTAEGREALRRAAPVHLRGVQRHFAARLTDSDVVALARVFAKLPGASDDA